MRKFIEPFHNQVVFKQITPDTTDGGLVIPGNATSNIPRCIVVAVGPGLRLPSTGERVTGTPIEPGDEILIRQSATVSIAEQTGETLFMVADSDVIGRVLIDRAPHLEAV